MNPCERSGGEMAQRPTLTHFYFPLVLSSLRGNRQILSGGSRPILASQIGSFSHSLFFRFLIIFSEKKRNLKERIENAGGGKILSLCVL